MRRRVEERGGRGEGVEEEGWSEGRADARRDKGDSRLSSSDDVDLVGDGERL